MQELSLSYPLVKTLKFESHCHVRPPRSSLWVLVVNPDYTQESPVGLFQNVDAWVAPESLLDSKSKIISELLIWGVAIV